MEEIKFVFVTGAKAMHPKDFLIPIEIIKQVFDYDKNAFLLGCGRETMMYKFFRATGKWYNKQNVRRSIEEHFEPIKQHHEYTKFKMI